MLMSEGDETHAIQGTRGSLCKTNRRHYCACIYIINPELNLYLDVFQNDESAWQQLALLYGAQHKYVHIAHVI